MFWSPKFQTIALVVAACTLSSLLPATSQAQTGPQPDGPARSAYEARLQAMQNARARGSVASRAGETVQDSQSEVDSDNRIQQASYQQPVQYVHPDSVPGSSSRSGRGVRVAARPLPRQNAQVQQRQAQRSINQAANQQRTQSRPPQRHRMAQNTPAPTRPRTSQRVQPAGNRGTEYRPQHMRTAQLYDPSMVGGPIVGSGEVMGGPVFDGGVVMNGTVIDGAPIGSSFVNDGFVEDGFVDNGYVNGGYLDEGYVDGGYIDGGCCGDGGCSSGSCGQSYFDDCGGCDPCQPCWLDGLGRIFRNGEYFVGATGFKNSPFNVGTNPSQTVHDCNFGMYGGFNLGIPLCKLTCGALSGQFGIRSVQSNFNGSTFTPENRDQLFVTAGVFRRVDYGIQAGIVYDYLHEEWFAETDLSQIRGDLSWVFGNGNSFGFRFTNSIDEDTTNGILNGSNFSSLSTNTSDWYRLYLRRNNCLGGFGEIFAGSADADYAILGVNSDLPLSGCLAVQSGFTYYISDEVTDGAGRDTDAWNIYMGFSFRPRGEGWYRFYERPLLPVADNGSMLMQRR